MSDSAINDRPNDAVIIERHDDVALLRLNRPATRNALAMEII